MPASKAEREWRKGRRIEIGPYPRLHIETGSAESLLVSEKRQDDESEYGD